MRSQKGHADCCVWGWRGWGGGPTYLKEQRKGEMNFYVATLFPRIIAPYHGSYLKPCFSRILIGVIKNTLSLPMYFGLYEIKFQADILQPPATLDKSPSF